MEHLDFRQSGKQKPLPAGAAQTPVYDPAIARAFFQSVGKEETVPVGTKFFTENEKASRILLKRDKMYLLTRGAVNLVARDKLVGTVKEGEIFGEMAAITESPRSATAVAKTQCKVIALDERQFSAALQKKPEFALMLLGLMIRRLRSMLAALSGIPSVAGAPSSPRVFDKGTLRSLQEGLGHDAVVRYERGKVIMVQGQVGALMYAVLEGQVAISLRGTTVEAVGPGGVFGELALVDQAPRAANAAAQTDCVLLAINRSVFITLVKSNPAFGVSLLTAVAERVRNVAAGVN